jgi:hypothetical protein
MPHSTRIMGIVALLIAVIAIGVIVDAFCHVAISLLAGVVLALAWEAFALLREGL